MKWKPVLHLHRDSPSNLLCKWKRYTFTGIRKWNWNRRYTCAGIRLPICFACESRKLVPEFSSEIETGVAIAPGFAIQFALHIFNLQFVVLKSWHNHFMLKKNERNWNELGPRGCRLRFRLMTARFWLMETTYMLHFTHIFGTWV